MDPTSLLLIAAAGVAFYLLIIRPQNNRKRAQAEMMRNLAPGTEVMTTAGMFGTIAVVTDEQISLEVSPGVFVRVVPQAIGRVIEPATAEPAGEETTDTDAPTGDAGPDPKPPVD